MTNSYGAALRFQGNFPQFCADVAHERTDRVEQLFCARLIINSINMVGVDVSCEMPRTLEELGRSLDSLARIAELTCRYE